MKKLSLPLAAAGLLLLVVTANAAPKLRKIKMEDVNFTGGQGRPIGIITYGEDPVPARSNFIQFRLDVRRLLPNQRYQIHKIGLPGSVDEGFPGIINDFTTNSVGNAHKEQGVGRSAGDYIWEVRVFVSDFNEPALVTPIDDPMIFTLTAP